MSADTKVKTQCIGALECLALHPNSIAANRVGVYILCGILGLILISHSQIISDYFISFLPSGSEPSSIDTEPLIQAISALIDIYSNEDMPYDVNFRQGQYLNRLISSVEGTRKAIRNIDRRKEGGKELRVRGDEVQSNLIAFIKYRRRLGW